MATIIDLGKLRFEYRGEYSAATTYEANDVVKYGGNLYVYKYGLNTSGNTPQVGSLYWDLMVEGFKFEGAYDSDTTYNVGDGFSYGGIVYITTANSVSGARPPRDSFYSTFVDGIQYEGAYDGSTQYQKSDIVTYGPKTYIATNDPTIGVNPLSTASWDVFADGIDVTGNWIDSSSYKPGEIVAWGNKQWLSTADIAAGDSPNANGSWEVFSEGQTWRDSYDGGVKYYEHDIVTYGTATYRVTRDNVVGSTPSGANPLYQKIQESLKFKGDYNGGTTYFQNELVTYGTNLYRSLADANAGNDPESSPSSWEELTSGSQARGAWAPTTLYYEGDIVTNGNTTYYKTGASHTSAATFTLDASNWTTLADGVRYRSGGYDSAGDYLINDIVQYGTSTYIALQDFTASGNFSAEIGAGKWEILAAGGSSVFPSITPGTDAGTFLGTPDGVAYNWARPGETDKVYYVTTDGTDDSSRGTTIDNGWASLGFALQNVTGPATIFVKEGTYTEALPMTIPANITLKGDGQRNTIIQPQVGDSQETMFYVNNGVLVEEFQFKGLTGFQLSDSFPHDMEYATIGGVYFRLDPTAVITKSPYIKESTAFSSGGIGAIVDGGLNSNPANNGSMVFHTFTQVHDGGAGFWVRRNGKSEIVSCFTYYNDFGLVTTGGGKIRALNCNNSYGTYGAVSEGYDSAETAINGQVRGVSLFYDGNTLAGGTEFTVGTYITGVPTNNTIDRATREANVSFHSPNHGLVTGQRISIDNLTPPTWASLFTADSYWVTVTDSSNFVPFTDSARTSGIDTQLAGGRVTTTTSITDIARQNPVRITVPSAVDIDSYEISYIQSVGGMTQMNNLWFTFDSGAGTAGTFLYARTAENVKITVDNQGATTMSSSGTTGGQAISASNNPDVYLYRGSRYRFIGDSNLQGGRFYLATSTNWDSSNFTDEFTTGILNSRNTLDGDSTLDSTVDGLLFEVGPTTPDTLYYHWDSAPNGTQMRGTINVINPPFIDATSYSIYSSGGQIRQMDSGDYFDSAHWNAEAPTGYVVNSQPSQDKIYVENITFPGFPAGTTITDSSGAITVDLLDSGHYGGQYGFIVTLDNLNAEPKPGGSLSFSDDLDLSGERRAYVIQTVSSWDSAVGQATVTLSQEKLETNASADDASVTIRTNYSQVRLTGHDFLSVGTGGVTTTNYPGLPTQSPSQGNEVIETAPGRVYYVSTDQDGNFRVGNYFRIDQATGRATLDASAFDLSGLTSLRLGSIGAQIGEAINEFSSDETMSGNSNLAVPTEKATKGYVDRALKDITFTYGSGDYDSSNTEYYPWDSSRDSGGPRIKKYTVGNATYSDIVYDSYSDEILSYKEATTLGYGFNVTRNVVVTYNSDGSIERITTTEL